MAIQCLMTWEGKKSRWRKMHKGKIFTISCRELNAPTTKEASYLAANAWWRSKHVEVESTKPNHVHQRVIAENQRRVDWSLAHGYTDLAEQLKDTAETIRDLPEDDSSIVDILHNPSPVAVTAWHERFVGESVLPVADTIGGHAQRYLELELARVNSGGLSPSGYDNIRLCLGYFESWIGKTNSPTTINADCWERYWIHLTEGIASGASRGYQTTRLRFAKSFIAWLASKDIIPIPKNLIQRRYSFADTPRTVTAFTIAEAKELIVRAPGQLRLHLLLMLNCGFTQIDIAQLHPREVDWQSGRITRRRTKTRHHAHIPIVSYRLWSETFRLLSEYRSENSEHVLLTTTGRVWVSDELRDGIRVKRDVIKSNYRHLEPKHGLKTFRATSASLLDSHREYGRLAQHFLGHSGRSIAERHYLARDGDDFGLFFDEAVSWLGEQYGF